MSNGVFNAEEYDSWYDRHRDIYAAEIEAIKSFADKYKNPRLEIGVGTGRFAQPLRIDYGIDPDENMLRFARMRGIKAVKGVGEELPFPDGFFNMVLIATTLPFFTNARKVIEEAHRVLRDDGGLIIAFIPKNSHYGRKYTEMGKKGDRRFCNVHFYTLDEVIALIKGLFKIDEMRSTLIGEDVKLDVAEGYIDESSFVVLHCRKIREL